MFAIGVILNKYTQNKFYATINYTLKRSCKYDIEFKKSIIALYQNGKYQANLSREYGVSLSAIAKWIKQFSEVKIDDDTILSAKQVRELQKRMLFLKRIT